MVTSRLIGGEEGLEDLSWNFERRPELAWDTAHIAQFS